MRSAITVAAIAAAQAQQLVSDSQTRVYTGAFGVISEETTTADLIHRNVTFPTLPFALDYE